MIVVSGGFTKVNAQSALVLKDYSEFLKVRISVGDRSVFSLKTAYFRDLTPLFNRPPVETVSQSGRLYPVLRQPLQLQAIAPDYIFSQWGVICVGEYRLQQKTGLPLRFRLGSLEYVDTLEGK